MAAEYTYPLPASQKADLAPWLASLHHYCFDSFPMDINSQTPSYKNCDFPRYLTARQRSTIEELYDLEEVSKLWSSFLPFRHVSGVYVSAPETNAILN